MSHLIFHFLFDNGIPTECATAIATALVYRP